MMQRIIPCILHLSMAITRTLLKLLVKDTKLNSKLANELQVRLESKQIGIKLPKNSSKNADKKYTFEEQIEKARLQRPELLRILEQQEYLLDALNIGKPKSTLKNKKVQK